jgi:hypothetical protein
MGPAVRTGGRGGRGRQAEPVTPDGMIVAQFPRLQAAQPRDDQPMGGLTATRSRGL